MNSSSKSRTIGAFVVGFGIVAGAYAINALDNPSTEAIPVVTEAPLRVALDVTDSNSDGIEDWREEFVKTAPIITNINTDNEGEYIPPSTLTGQVALSFMQSTLSSKIHGSFADSQADILDKTVKNINKQAGDKIYNVKDIIVSQDSSDEAIRNYGNSLANAITENNVPNLRDKLQILKEILETDKPKQEDIDELRIISEIYLNTKNATLNIPVPKKFVKEHLDLINVYHALYKDINIMSQVHEDPLLALVRLKRYEEDIKGLTLALQNMYYTLEANSEVFKEDDPAILFSAFSPEYNRQ